jgi:hypothetical protein
MASQPAPAAGSGNAETSTGSGGAQADIGAAGLDAEPSTAGGSTAGAGGASALGTEAGASDGGDSGAETGGRWGLGGTAGIAGAADAGGAAGAPAAGGTGDMQAVAGMGGAAAAEDPCATALLCDDFESYAAGQAPGGMWSARENSGSVGVDASQQFSGAQSVRFSVTGSGSSRTAFIRVTDASIFPVADNHLFGRMMYWLESAPQTAVHWTMVEGGGTVPGQTYHALYRYGGQHPLSQGQTFVGNRLMANYDTPDWYGNMNTPGSDCWRHAQSDVMPTGKWVCVEWEFDGPNNTERLWLDGQAITDVTVMGTADACLNAASSYVWEAPSFTQIDIGWESYQSDEPRTAYVDDVVISTTRVGCP